MRYKLHYFTWHNAFEFHLCCILCLFADGFYSVVCVYTSIYTRLLMNLCAVSTLGPSGVKAAVNLCVQDFICQWFFFFFFFNFDNVVLVSTIQQCKSAIIILTFPASPHASRSSRIADGAACATQHLLTSCPSCPLSVYMLMLLSPFVPLSSPPPCPQVHSLHLRLSCK